MRLIPQLLLIGTTLIVPLVHAATTTTDAPPSQHAHAPAHPRAKKIPTEVRNRGSDNLSTAPQVTQEEKKTKKPRKPPTKEIPLPSRQSPSSQTTPPPSRSSAPQSSQTVAPEGATARCKDGSFSHSQHHRGACSRHGGVDGWLDNE
ncbi:TPA: DUF3761 domain-containing protein [Serratia marcescens]|uniref:DUF3761 domain-containing protein n=2 Tax=Serratia TaxID=613 RepID=A0A9X9G073_9GAMM|nr:DUF3761 domain-containing protein [Serratia marcescens]MBS3894511.1 DUF3761 domain-containing protein [Serratia marcescens]TXE22523.1 DUF3761 domain-containing protein [Serratia ureilytica]HBC7422447.1 DUF3761 domain-containing protein [Serratia marcescens]